MKLATCDFLNVNRFADPLPPYSLVKTDHRSPACAKATARQGQSLTTIAFSAVVPGEDAEWGAAWVLLWA
jgi:hypothetical protein